MLTADWKESIAAPHVPTRVHPSDSSQRIADVLQFMSSLTYQCHSESLVHMKVALGVTVISI